MAVALLGAAAGVVPAHAADVQLLNDGELDIWGREQAAGVVEAAVPTAVNGTLRGSFNVIEYSDRVPGTTSWPLTVVDIANTFRRLTYQRADGTTATLGTSVVGTPSFRTSAGLRYVPTVARIDLTTGGTARVRTDMTARFGLEADIQTARTFPQPALGTTTTDLSVTFRAQTTIALGPHRGSDAFRLAGMSSMFIDARTNDASVLYWKEAGHTLHTQRLTTSTPRGTHLFVTPPVIDVGGFIELWKEPGAAWFPDSPSMRLTLTSLSNVAGRVGIQGWLDHSIAPSDDSLNIWIEWLDAPATLSSGLTMRATFSLTASPPRPAPSPRWNGARDVGGGWAWLPWFGYFSDLGGDWLYHAQHGFLYAVGETSTGLWLWASDLGWMWTRDDLYPFLYRLQGNAWLWYQEDSAAPRWFYNSETAAWESH